MREPGRVYYLVEALEGSSLIKPVPCGSGSASVFKDRSRRADVANVTIGVLQKCGTGLEIPPVMNVLLLHCLIRTLIAYRTSVFLPSHILNIHRICSLSIDPLIIHRRSALIRRSVIDALPSVLITPADSSQTEAGIVGIAALCSARGTSGDGSRHAAFAGGVGAAVATMGEEMADCRNGRGEAADAGLHIGAQDDVSDPERKVRLRLEFVDKGDADHGDDGCQRGKGKQAEGLDLGLSLHLGVPQDDGRHDDQGHVGQDGRDGRSVCDDEECLRRGTVSFTTQNQGWSP